MNYFLKVIGFFLIISLSAIADDNRRDGNWWRQQPRLSKLDYSIGVLDGASLGNRFSYWKFTYGKNNFDNAVIKGSIESYGEHAKKYLYNVTTGQIADGLDNFYLDYRNRKILVIDGFWIVLKSIAGEPVEELTNTWRQNAAKEQ